MGRSCHPGCANHHATAATERSRIDAHEPMSGHDCGHASRLLRGSVAVAVLGSCISLMASDYLTEGNDPGRTGWMKDEKVFTLANVKDMRLLWKVKLESQPREMHNLFAPLIAERVTTARGSREVAIVAGISDDLFAIDVASGELLWKKRYESTFAPTDKTVYHTLCLGGQTAMPAMDAGLTG